MRTFVEWRKILFSDNDLKEQVRQLKDHLGEHDLQLNQIYDAQENLLDDTAAQTKWSEWERIGFKKECKFLNVCKLKTFKYLC